MNWRGMFIEKRSQKILEWHIMTGLKMEVVVLGPRGFGKVHLNSLAKLDVDVSIVSRDGNEEVEGSSLPEIRRVYGNIDEAISSNADIVDIVLPHDMHYDVAMKAMQHGKHVLVEKPIAKSREEAEGMIAFAEKKGLKFMVAEQYHFDSSAVWVSEAIRRGTIGRPLSIFVRDQRIHSREGWRNDSKRMGGGALIDGGIHFIHTLLQFGGSYNRVDAHTFKGTSSIAGEDNSLAIFHFENGAHGLLYYSWSYRFPPALPAWEIVGESGSIVEDTGTRPGVDFKDMKKTRYAYGLPVLNGKRQEIEIRDVFDAEIAGFIEAVRKDGDVPMDPRLASRDLAAVLDIYENSCIRSGTKGA